MTELHPTSTPSPVSAPNGHDRALMARAQLLFEGGVRSLVDIAGELGIGRTTLWDWGRHHGWTRPEGAPKGPDATRRARTNTDEKAAATRRRRSVDRLWRVCERQIRQIEARLRLAEADEKDARTLGTLARTLDTLMTLDRDNGATADRPEPVDREELNAELARRIARWAEGREETE